MYVAAALASAAPPPSQRMTVPTDVLWQEHGPIFPRTWSDNLDDERLHHLDGVGHFTPVEAPSTFAEWIKTTRPPRCPKLRAKPNGHREEHQR